MGIITRLIKICKADVHGVMDQLEDKELLLKQHLRDMQDVLTAKENELQNMTASRSRISRDREAYRLDCEKLEQDLSVAIEKDKDDIARMLIRKLKPLEDLHNDLSRQLDDLDKQIGDFKESIAGRKIQYEQLKQRAAEYCQKNENRAWEGSIAAIGPENAAGELTDEEVELELLQRKDAAGMNA